MRILNLCMKGGIHPSEPFQNGKDFLRTFSYFLFCYPIPFYIFLLFLFLLIGCCSCAAIASTATVTFIFRFGWCCFSLSCFVHLFLLCYLSCWSSGALPFPFFFSLRLFLRLFSGGHLTLFFKSLGPVSFLPIRLIVRSMLLSANLVLQRLYGNCYNTS